MLKFLLLLHEYLREDSGYFFYRNVHGEVVHDKCRARLRKEIAVSRVLRGSCRLVPGKTNMPSSSITRYFVSVTVL